MRRGGKAFFFKFLLCVLGWARTCVFVLYLCCICVGGQKTSFQKPVFFYHVCSGTRLRAPDSVSAVPTENLCSLREDLKGLGGGSRESKGICVLGTHKGRLKEEDQVERACGEVVGDGTT